MESTSKERLHTNESHGVRNGTNEGHNHLNHAHENEGEGRFQSRIRRAHVERCDLRP